jgi:hypothetical protein
LLLEQPEDFMQHHIIDRKTFKTQKWAHGETTELYVYPPDSGKTFRWRVSSATVTNERSNFTVYYGIKRWIMPFDGPLTLNHSYDGEPVYSIAMNPYETHCFKGDWDTEGIGIVRDFNLMLREGVAGKLKAIKLFSEQKVVLGDVFKEAFESPIISEDRQIILGFFSIDSGFKLANEKQVIVCMKDDLLLIAYSISEIEQLKLYEMSHPHSNTAHVVSFVVSY